MSRIKRVIFKGEGQEPDVIGIPQETTLPGIIVVQTPSHRHTFTQEALDELVSDSSVMLIMESES